MSGNKILLWKLKSSVLMWLEVWILEIIEQMKGFDHIVEADGKI